jgi:hypothetical protein
MAWLTPRFLVQPVREFARFAAQLTPWITVKVIPPGGAITYQGDTTNASK